MTWFNEKRIPNNRHKAIDLFLVNDCKRTQGRNYRRKKSEIGPRPNCQARCSSGKTQSTKGKTIIARTTKFGIKCLCSVCLLLNFELVNFDGCSVRSFLELDPPWMKFQGVNAINRAQKKCQPRCLLLSWARLVKCL